MIALGVDIFLVLLAIYLVLGLVFCLYFLLAGITRIDQGTQGAPWHFKLIILPGVILFWSVLITKIKRSHDKKPA